MHYHALVVENTALYLISVSHDDRHLGDKAYGCTHLVFKSLVLALVIVGIQCQYGTCQLVHDVL